MLGCCGGGDIGVNDCSGGGDDIGGGKTGGISGISDFNCRGAIGMSESMQVLCLLSFHIFCKLVMIMLVVVSMLYQNKRAKQR